MIKDYLSENLEEAKRLVNEVYSYNGALGYLIMYENDEEFFNTFYQEEPSEAVRAVYYGNYKYMDDYVRFDGYYNLESFDEWQYNNLIRNNLDDIIKETIHCIEYIDLNNEDLKAMFEEYIEEIV